MVPMNEVATYSMPSVHWPPNRAVRIVLIEKVVFPVTEYEAIGIIHPTCWWGKVKLRTMLFCVRPDLMLFI